eukprot:3612193-Prymnesium_polylepis.3
MAWVARVGQGRVRELDLEPQLERWSHAVIDLTSVIDRHSTFCRSDTWMSSECEWVLLQMSNN